MCIKKGKIIFGGTVSIHKRTKFVWAIISFVYVSINSWSIFGAIFQHDLVLRLLVEKHDVDVIFIMRLPETNTCSKFFLNWKFLIACRYLYTRCS